MNWLFIGWEIFIWYVIWGYLICEIVGLDEDMEDMLILFLDVIKEVNVLSDKI